jgi:spermidine synthase
VAPLFLDGQSGRALYLDRMVHGYIFPGDATKLSARSSEIFAELAQSQLSGAEANALVLGGGGYVLPRYLVARFPAARVNVVEIDPAVTQVARDRLGLEPGPRLAIHHEDARHFVRRRRLGAKQALVVADVFTDLSLPFHLSTLEFAREVRALLKADGVYALHLVDGDARAFLASVVYTLCTVFTHVHVARGDRHGAGRTASFVVIASDAELGPAKGLRSRLIAAEELDGLLRSSSAQLLTDAHAPIEHMRARVL